MGALGAGTCCADKSLATHSARSPRLALAFAMNIGAQTAPFPRNVDIRVAYERSGGTRVNVASVVTPVTGGSQAISVPLDITECLADAERPGARDVCPLLIAIALRDTSATALDSVSLGPVNARAGQTPALPAVDLAIQRYSVRTWATDESLRLGTPPGGGAYAGLTGVVAGPGPPIVYAFGTSIGVYESGVWRHVLSPFSGAGAFVSLAMLTPTDGYAALIRPDGSGLYRFNGTAVDPAPLLADTVRSVHVIGVGAGRFVVAGGSAAGAAVWRSNGTTWIRDALPGESQVVSVCATSATEAFALTAGGTGWRWDGIEWTSGGIAIAAATSTVYCVAPGVAFVSALGALSRWNGTGWTPVSTVGLPAGTNRLFAPRSLTEMYALAFDAATNLRRWYVSTGAGWQPASGASAFGQGVAGNGGWVDPRGTHAYGLLSFSRIEELTVATNTRATIAYAADVRDLAMSSPSHAVAVGWNMVLARWDGTRWTVDAPPAGVHSVRILQGVWTEGPSNAWAVGNAGTILRWDGVAWTAVSHLGAPIATPIADYNAVWGSGTTVLIAASSGVLRCTAPTVCAYDAVPGTGPLYGIWGSAPNNVSAVGATGRIVRYDGTTWTEVPSPTTRPLVRVSGSSASNIWAVGDSVLVRFDGTAWQAVPMTGELAQMQSPFGGTAQFSFQLGLWVAAPNDVYLGSSTGRIARFDGTTWRSMPANVSRRVSAISGVPGFGALALTGFADQVVLRGVGPTGGLAAPILRATVWP